MDYIINSIIYDIISRNNLKVTLIIFAFQTKGVFPMKFDSTLVNVQGKEIVIVAVDTNQSEFLCSSQ